MTDGLTDKPVAWTWTLWLTGLTAMLLLLGTRVFAMQLTVRRATILKDPRWRKHLREARDSLGIRTDVQLRVRDSHGMPGVWGLRLPVILLPQDCDVWTDARCRDVLAHELAHVARRDVLILLLAHLVCAVHWYNPLAWMLKRRLEKKPNLPATT